jgi:hypothetical protein
MKTSSKLALSVSLLAVMLFTSTIFAIPAFARNANQMVGKNPDFVLNILGKKEGWEPNGSFDNFDRHTIFVPEDTTGSDPGTYGDGVSFADSILIWMQSGPEFGVLDGNACDDGNASIQVEKGRYRVFVSVHGKPSNENKGENRFAGLKGWYYDDEGELGTYLYELGTAKTLSRGKGSPEPVEVTDLFEVEYALVYEMLVHMFMDAGMTEDEAEAAAIALLEEHGYELGDLVWIFDFLEMLNVVFNDPDYYFWQLTNRGLKHIQVRFYKA